MPGIFSPEVARVEKSLIVESAVHCAPSDRPLPLVLRMCSFPELYRNGDLCRMDGSEGGSC